MAIRVSKESHEQGSKVLTGLGLQEATGEQRCHSSAGVGLKLECEEYPGLSRIEIILNNEGVTGLSKTGTVSVKTGRRDLLQDKK